MAKSSVDALRSMLSDLSLDSRGHKSTLLKRLAKATKANQISKDLAASNLILAPEGQIFDSFLVCDVEATCEDAGVRTNGYSYPNEIIEFPAILLQWRRKVFTKFAGTSESKIQEESRTSLNSEEGLGSQPDETPEGDWSLEIIAIYHTYVKPVWRPILTEFCTNLTGIQQDQVDSAPTYPEMHQDFYNNFILAHGLFTKTNKTIWVTDGPWDLRDFIAKAGHINQTPRPPWLTGPIIDLRLTTSEFFSTLAKRKPQPPRILPPPLQTKLSQDSVLTDLGTLPASPASSTSSLDSDPSNSNPSPFLDEIPNHLLNPPPTLQIHFVLASLHLAPFIGRAHSGLDDSRNIARILQELARRGMRLRGNRAVGGITKEERWSWMKKGGAVNWKG